MGRCRNPNCGDPNCVNGPNVPCKDKTGNITQSSILKACSNFLSLRMILGTLYNSERGDYGPTTNDTREWLSVEIEKLKRCNKMLSEAPRPPHPYSFRYETKEEKKHREESMLAQYQAIFREIEKISPIRLDLFHLFLVPEPEYVSPQLPSVPIQVPELENNSLVPDEEVEEDKEDTSPSQRQSRKAKKREKQQKKKQKQEEKQMMLNAKREQKQREKQEREQEEQGQ